MFNASNSWYDVKLNGTSAKVYIEVDGEEPNPKDYKKYNYWVEHFLADAASTWRVTIYYSADKFTQAPKPSGIDEYGLNDPQREIFESLVEELKDIAADGLYTDIGLSH